MTDQREEIHTRRLHDCSLLTITDSRGRVVCEIDIACDRPGSAKMVCRMRASELQRRLNLEIVTGLSFTGPHKTL